MISFTQNVPQEPILGEIPVGIYINHLEDGTEYTLEKFAIDIKLRRMTDTTKGCAVTQSDLKRLKKWADRNLLKFIKKCKALHLNRNNSTYQNRLGTERLESNFEQKTSRFLVDTKLTVSQQCTLVTKKADSLLDSFKGSIASRLREVITLLSSALVRFIWNTDF